MMSWNKQRLQVQEWLLMRILPPHVVAGMTFCTWKQVLRANRYQIDSWFLPRALTSTALCLANSFAARHERSRYDQLISRVQPAPPLFVLGHWRTGTTHLHNLLALDPQFVAPTTFQVFNPWSFLTAGSLTRRLARWSLGSGRRPQDNVEIRLDTPQEDEYAICQMTGLSTYVSDAFLRAASDYDRYIAMDDVTPQELDAWKQALVYLVRKVCFVDGNGQKIPLLKSPPHTARIRHLLSVFPDARFVHISRNPFVVFQSTHHALLKLMPWTQLQRFDRSQVTHQVIERYRALYTAYLEQRPLIPEERFHELRYEDLVRDPVGELKRVYQRLELPGFAGLEPRLGAYLGSLASYETNRFDPLPEATAEELRKEWQPMFERWG